MLRYETLLLTVPEITSDEASTLEKQLDKVVGEGKGNVLSYERWGKYRLAYPVRKNDYGIYYLMRFELPEERKDSVLENLRTLCQVKFVDIIMRHSLVRLPSTGSLDYKRPDSLEEAPSKDIDTFVKESKSLLAAGHSPAPREEFTHEESVER